MATNKTYKRGNYNMSKSSEQGKTKGAGRTRNWTFIVYPDSVVENWRDILDEEYVPWVESPLHDKDLNADGTLKKAHIHVLMLYESVKTNEQIEKLTEAINATKPQKCNGVKGLVRYMIHLDNPEKYQYDKVDIISHRGADIIDLMRPTASDRYALIKEMLQFIDDNELKEFKYLMDYAMRNRFDDWFPLLCDNSAYVVQQYLKSNRHKADR